MLLMSSVFIVIVIEIHDGRKKSKMATRMNIFIGKSNISTVYPSKSLRIRTKVCYYITWTAHNDKKPVKVVVKIKILFINCYATYTSYNL